MKGSRPDRGYSPLRRGVLAASLAALLLLAACAPDAMRNVATPRFNSYLDSLKRACPNLQIGPNNIGLWLQYGGGTDNYTYWLDMTARLYYRRISVAEYRASVAAQLGGSASDADAFACIVDNLPAQR